MENPEVSNTSNENKTTKRYKKRKKINAKVNFVNHKKNITSILYEKDGLKCSTYIKGVFNGDLEIEYDGDCFNNSVIINVKERMK